MPAVIDVNFKLAGYTIEDYLNRNWGAEPEFYNSPILNIVHKKGIMGTPEQIKLKELYPGLEEAVLKHLSKKIPSKLMIYEEEGKPPIINMFIYHSADQPYDYWLKESAIKSFRVLNRSGKIQSDNFVFFGKTQKKRIEEGLKYRMRYRNCLYELAE